MNNFLTENNKSPIADFHAIVTDHPRMKALGLGVFTTGDLNTWLHNLKQPHPVAANPMPEAFYSNWTAINHTTIDTLLGTPLKDTDNWGSFEGWRKHGATGKYEHQEWDEWSWSFDDVSFDHDDLLFDDFWINIAAGSIMTDFVPDGLEITEGFSYEFEEPESFGRNFFSGTTSPILQIIEMNRLMTQFKRYYSKTEWHDSSHHKLTSAKLFAMDNFLTDVKASKYGYVEFSGEVPFYINIADGGIKCDKKEMVKYKLYLYDDSKVRNTDKVAVLKDPKIGGYKRDTFGRLHRETVDGDTAEADTTNPADQAIGELERSWNPYTAKWESGTQNVFAKVVSHINAAVNNPTVESLEHSDIKVDLDGDEDRHFAPSSGLVMPIEMQNANPMQWQPSYARTSGCRDQEKEKATLIGFNYNPLKSYPRDTLVMLSKIGGIWHVTDMGSGISLADESVEAIFEGKWQFQYLATNSNSFFTGYKFPFDMLLPNGEVNAGNRLTGWNLTGDHVERSFHRDYYWDDPVNGGGDPSNDNNDYLDLETSSIDIPKILWSKKGIEKFYATRGWWQFTSFDFMDNLIGGTHNGNYIASTNCLNDSAGRKTQIEPNTLGRGAGSTGGFFGCVFPDGYGLDSTSTFFGDRDFVVVPYSNKGTVDGGGYFNTDELSSDQNVQPFEDPTSEPYRETDPETGAWDQVYKPSRSTQRMMLSDYDPEVEVDLDDGAHFRSLSPMYAPSMFYSETHKTQRDLKQLPADIGTLSSPSGKNGCPIQNIHALDILHGDKKGVELQDAVSGIFKERYWLARTDLGSPDDGSRRYPDLLSSAYGFKPKKTSRVMFRPLKVGTYTQFFPLLGHYLSKDRVGHDSLARGEWSAEVVRQYHFAAGTDPNKHTIASPTSKARELAHLDNEAVLAGTVPAVVQGKKLLYSESKGLLLRGDIHPASTNVGGAPDSSYFYYPSYGSRVHDKNFWRQQIFNLNTGPPLPGYGNPRDGLREDDKGANAFGVIGAVATTTANNQIAFSTQNRIGMMDESLRGNVSYLEPTWGGNASSPNANRTTELHAMVYHAHPRSQTIYDPRYFAVHHFNPHILDAEQYDENTKFWKVKFESRVAGEPLTTMVNEIQSRRIKRNDLGHAIEDDDGFSTIDKENRKYEYEVAEPTRFGDDGGQAIPCNVGDWVFKDKVFDGATGGPLTRLHQEDNWNFTSKRLGKLLPYRYTVKVLGAPWPLNVLIDIVDDSEFVQHSNALPEAGITAVPSDGGSTITLYDKMVIINRGKDYEVGDIVGNEGMGVLLSVMAIENNVDDPDADPDDADQTIDGVIKELQLYSLGNIDVTSCATSSKLILPNKLAGYTIKTQNTEDGGGFSAFFVNAKVVEETRIDHKPGLVGEDRSILLSATPYGGFSDSSSGLGFDQQSTVIGGVFVTQGSTGQSARVLGYDQGIVYNGRDDAIDITSEYRSPNRKYDIFFHFHNDITHTWMDPEYGDGQNSDDVDEQHITTQITAF